MPRQILGRAENYRWIFNQIWDRLWPLLELSECADDVTKAFERAANPYQTEFVPAFSSVVLWTMRDVDFPKRKEPQINFMADSLAGLGSVSPRRSRDICQEQRDLINRTHRILRYEYYVECSCGYKGRSRDHSCPRCGAVITFVTDSPFNVE